MQASLEAIWGESEQGQAAGPVHISRVMNEWFLHHQRQLREIAGSVPIAGPPETSLAACTPAKLSLCNVV